MGAAGWLGSVTPLNTGQGRPVTEGGAQPRIRIAVSTYS
jgi:hypothetical protein